MTEFSLSSKQQHKRRVMRQKKEAAFVSFLSHNQPSFRSLRLSADGSVCEPGAGMQYGAIIDT